MSGAYNRTCLGPRRLPQAFCLLRRPSRWVSQRLRGHPEFLHDKAAFWQRATGLTIQNVAPVSGKSGLRLCHTKKGWDLARPRGEPSPPSPQDEAKRLRIVRKSFAAGELRLIDPGLFRRNHLANTGAGNLGHIFCDKNAVSATSLYKQHGDSREHNENKYYRS